MSDSHEKSEGHGKKHKKHGGGHGGSHEEAHEGAPEWLISFADNVALMMGFFVILLAMNMAKATVGGGGEKGETGAKSKEEMLDFAIAVREAFNNPVTLSSTDPKDEELVKRLMQRAGKSETRDPGVKGHERDVQSIRPSDYYAVSGSVPFAENSSEMPEVGHSVIEQVVSKVRGMRLIVEVRGHVSSVEAQRGAEQSMKLSWDRATAVSRALAEAGVDWWQMRVVVCGDHDRVEAYPNNRAIDKANARVEIILTDQVVPDQVPTKYEDAPDGASVSASKVNGVGSSHLP